MGFEAQISAHYSFKMAAAWPSIFGEMIFFLW
jgi:hypothetical protein